MRFHKLGEEGMQITINLTDEEREILVQSLNKGKEKNKDKEFIVTDKELEKSFKI